MNQDMQNVAAEFYETRTERAFNKFYRMFSPMVRNISYRILKDTELADDNVSHVFLKLYQNQNFIFDPTKSHLAYVYTMATNRAKFAFKKRGRDRHVFENMLTAHVEDEGRDSLIDRIFSENSEDEATPDFDFNYLHNDQEVQISRVMELIDQLGPETSALLRDAWGIGTGSTLTINVRGVQDLGEIVDREAEITTDSAPAGLGSEYEEEMGWGEGMSYDKIAEKYKLRTSGAVKTRVFRAKTQLRALLAKEMNGAQLSDGDKVSGEADFFYPSGALRHRATFIEGQLHGVFQRWLEDGTLVCKGEYSHGTKHGAWEIYFPTGILKLQGRYNQGQQDGVWSRYYPSGKLMETVDHLDGLGFFELRAEDGTLCESGLLELDEKGRHRVLEEEEA